MLIDTENLSTLVLPEVAALLLLYDKRVEKSTSVVEVKDVDIRRMFQNLEKKGLIISSVYSTDSTTEPPTQHISYSLIEKGRQAIADNCVSSKAILKTVNKESLRKRCDALATRLMEIYPLGKKPGTALMWRGCKTGISDKLQKLIEKGNEFTDEEAVAATKAYVGSFNGIYTTMRVLSYFLSKNEVVGGEVKKTCDFMTYIEDLRNNPHASMRKDWEVELK